jgi:uncharacterized protein (TIGR03792 family)
VEIELLSFVIQPPERLEDFIDADAEVWNPWLKQQRGYLRKTYTRYPNGRVHIRIFWASKRDWDAAAKDPQIPALDVRLQSRFLGVYTRLPGL